MRAAVMNRTLLPVLLVLTCCFSAWALEVEDSSVLPGEVSSGITPVQLYDSAVVNNIDLQKLSTEKKQAEIDRKNAEAAAFPQVKFETTLSYMTKPMIEPIKLAAGQLGAYDIGGSTIMLPTEDMVVYKGMENTHYDFKFIIDQPVFTWGKISNSILLYEDLNKIASLKLQSSRDEIRTRIYIYFTTLNYIEKIEERLSRQTSDAGRLIALAEQSYENGFILYADLLKARIQAKELQIAGAELTQQKEAALLALSTLSGRQELETADLDFSFIEEIGSIEIDSADSYLASALAGSSDIAMLNRLRSINEHRLSISEGAGYFKPDIGLHFEIGYSGPRLPFIEADWFGEDSLGISSTIALSTTIYDGGKIGYQIERDTEELNNAFHEYELGLERLTYFISETLLKLELNRQNIDYYRLLQQNDEQQISFRKTQFEAGSGREDELIKEQIALNTNRINEYREMIDFYKNYYSLLGVSCRLGR